MKTLIVFMDTQTSEARIGDEPLPTELAAAAADAASNAYAQLLGNRVRELRGSLSRAQLATLVGVHANTIGKFERGESMPDAFW